jgi:hypothetical protein
MMRVGTGLIGVLLSAILLTPEKAAAQTDFSGEWQPVRNQDNSENPLVGDWVGIPLNEAGFARAEAWDASIQSLPEWQCRPHGWAYIYRGPTAMRIWRDLDPVSRDVTAFHVQWQQSSDAPIYLDGRPHPPDYAPYSWMGFSTAVWEGDILKITTTHIKEDYYRRNGIFASDQAKVTTYWSRHGDFLTWINIVHDPVYLTEPLIRSGEYRLALGAPFPAHPCTPADEGHEAGVIPAHLPGQNPFLAEPAAKINVPVDVMRAGAAALYPEFRARLEKR